MKISKSFYCEECGNRESKTIEVTDHRRAEANNSVVVCKECLKKALELLENK